MIKKLIVSLLILFSCDFLYAQQPVVQGTVEDVFGLPQSSITVYFRNGRFQNNSDSAITDTAGFYTANLDSAYRDSLFVSLIDCDSIIMDTFYSPSSIQPPVIITKNFIYCASNPCSASFTYNTNGLNATLNALTQPNVPFNYFWDIGNGSGFVPGGQSFNASFNNFGPKGVCLNVQSVNPGCNIVVCDTVPILDSVFLIGLVTDTFGQPIPNKELIITFNRSFFIPTDTVFTDTAGVYEMKYRSFNERRDTIEIETDDCQGTFYTRFVYDLAIEDTVIGNFQVCDTINNCVIDFNFSPGLCDTVYFQSNILFPSPLALYTWSFGDGTGSSSPNPTHVYSQAGTYNVCMLYQDLNCTGTICYPVQVNPCPPGCSNSFTSLKYDATVLFDGKSNYPNPSAQYEWDFGDGNSAFGLQAINTYGNPGIYNVCFSTLDGGVQCSICDTISVNFDTSLARISGTIAIDNQAVNGETLVLYRDKGGSTAPFIEAIDTTISNNGSYAFYNINPDSYIVKAIPDNPNQNPGLIPSYWNNTSNPYWANAASILISSSLSSIDFNLSSMGQSSTGSANVEIDFKDNLGNFLPDATVWLVDLNGDIVKYGVTGNSGLMLDNLAYGTYYLRIDYPGYYMLPYTLTLLASDPNPRREFFLDGNLIVTTLKNSYLQNEMKIYPNPFKDAIFISDLRNEAEVKLYDIQGKEIEILIDKNADGMKVQAVKDLKKGFYLLEIFDPDRVQTFRLMKN